MNDKLNTLTARVTTAETDIVHAKSRVADLKLKEELVDMQCRTMLDIHGAG